MRRPNIGALGRQLTQFALVGGVGFVVDLAVFNLLLFTVFNPSRIHEGPLLAKTVSTIVAIAVNWIGNRYWTFGPHRSTRGGMEALEFLAVSILGMLVGLGCLWVSHYLLGLTSPLADNISANVVGLLLGSIVRFSLYRHWVYAPGRANRIADRAAKLDSASVAE